jgi:hypothetical protein
LLLRRGDDWQPVYEASNPPWNDEGCSREACAGRHWQKWSHAWGVAPRQRKRLLHSSRGRIEWVAAWQRQCSGIVSDLPCLLDDIATALKLAT